MKNAILQRNLMNQMDNDFLSQKIFQILLEKTWNVPSLRNEKLLPSKLNIEQIDRENVFFSYHGSSSKRKQSELILPQPFLKTFEKSGLKMTERKIQRFSQICSGEITKPRKVGYLQCIKLPDTQRRLITYVEVKLNQHNKAIVLVNLDTEDNWETHGRSKSGKLGYESLGEQQVTYYTNLYETILNRTDLVYGSANRKL